MKKVYIAGPMTGYPDNNFPAFDKAEMELKNQGYFVINPANIGRAMLNLNPYITREEILKEDIKFLLNCNCIYLLENFYESPGARMELNIARNLGIEIINKGCGEYLEKILL